MKKLLLFAFTLFAGTTMYAQSVTWSCEAESADGKKIDTAILTGTVSGSTTITAEDIAPASGMESTPTTCQKSFKTSDGTSTKYCDNGNCLIKWVNTSSDKAYITMDEGYSAGEYISFKISEGDQSKFLNLTGIKFDAVRLGTDDCRLNIKIIGNDGDYDSGWLITEGNWSELAGGVGSWVKEGTHQTSDGKDDPNRVGFQPSREDGSKANSSATDGCSHITIPTPADFPTNEIYEMEIQVVMYGIKSNKAIALHNFTVGLGTDTGISSVSADKAIDSDAPAYNIAGQRVSKDAKGLVIVGGKKYLNK